MSCFDTSRPPASRPARLMDLNEGMEGLWGEEDLGAILRHRLETPVQFYRPAGSGGVAGGSPAGGAGAGPTMEIRSFGELLQHGCPPPELLRRLSVFAQSTWCDPEAPLPREVAMVLYYAALAAGFVRCGLRVAEAEGSRTVRGLRWSAGREWAVDWVRRLCVDGLRALGAPAGVEVATDAGPQSLPAAAGSGAADGGWANVDPRPRVDGYDILASLGEGGMGTVWRAVQRSTRRTVALKLMHPSAVGSAKARLRFGQEIELAALLTHPHIARVYDSGMYGGCCYYAMELVEGVHLDRFVTDRRLTARDTVELMERVCRPVQFAHERGVIHRDLKPSNILVTPDGEPHVVDFGLAKALAADGGLEGPAVTVGPGVLGTPAFMAPEQAAGDAAVADTRADVYSLAAVLYLLLTGRPPHDLTGPRWLAMRRVAEGNVVRPRLARSDIDAELEAILLKGLARDPAARYASAGELADDLGRYLRGDPLTARPPTLAYFVRRRAYRHRVAIAVATTVAAVMIALVAYGYLRVRRERNIARAQQALAERYRRTAESSRLLAEERLANSLVTQGNAMAETSRWVEAKALYADARRSLAALGRPTLEPDLGLVRAYQFAPPPINVFPRDNNEPNTMTLSPDGRRSLWRCDDGTLGVWDLVTRRRVRTLTGFHGQLPWGAFAADGRTVYAANTLGELWGWDLTSGREVTHCKAPTTPSEVAFPPGGAGIAYCAMEIGVTATAAVDLSSGTERYRVGGAAPEEVALPLAVSPDGRMVVVADLTGKVRLLETSTGRELDAWVADERRIGRAAFSPDGKLLLTSDVEEAGPRRLTRRLRLRNISTGRFVRSIDGPFAMVCALRFSADGRRAYAAGRDGVVHVWDVAGGQVVRSLWGDHGPLQTTAFPKSAALAFSADDDGAANVWDLADENMDAPSVAFPRSIEALTLSPDDSTLWVGGTGYVSVADAASGRPLSQRPMPNTVQMLAAAPDGRQILCGCQEGQVLLCRADLRGEAAELGRHDWDVRAAVFTPDGSAALTINGNGAKLWDLSARRELRSVRAGATIERGLTLTRDGARAVALNAHSQIVGCDLATGAPFEWARLDRPEQSGSQIAFLEGGAKVVGACGATTWLWDAHTGRRLATFASDEGAIACVAASPEGSWVATGGSDGRVRIWDARSGRQLQTLSPPGQPVNCLALSHDGRRLYAGTSDGMLRHWDLGRPSDYERFARRLEAAKATLRRQLDDPEALNSLGEWYAFRGKWDWAAEVLEAARVGGAQVSHLTLGRCYWQTGKIAEARREFRDALGAKEAPDAYLSLWIGATPPTTFPIRPEGATAPAPAGP